MFIRKQGDRTNDLKQRRKKSRINWIYQTVSKDNYFNVNSILYYLNNKKIREKKNKKGVTLKKKIK